MADFISVIFQYFFYIEAFFLLFHLLIVFWVAKDIAQRTSSIFVQVLSISIVTAIPFIGLMIYLLIRPELLIYKEIREFLSSQQK